MSDVLIALGEEKKLFLSIWILGTLAAVAFVFSLPRLYSSSTLILPPQAMARPRYVRYCAIASMAMSSWVSP